MDLTSAPLRLPALRLDGDLMHIPTRPLRLDNVTNPQICPHRGNASAPSPPHRVQPQDQEHGQAVKEVIAERRQVIKATFRGLVEAARPDLGPAHPALQPPQPSCLPQLNIRDPQLLAQIKDAMELLAKVTQQRLACGHAQGAGRGALAGGQQRPQRKRNEDHHEHQEFYRHPGRFISWWCKAVGVVEGGEHKWRLPPNSVLRQPRCVAEVAMHRRLLGLPAHYKPATHIAVGVDPGVTQAIKAGHAKRHPATGQVLRKWEWELSKGQQKHDSGLTKAKQDTARCFDEVPSGLVGKSAIDVGLAVIKGATEDATT
ncbi:hypothetical protein HaLaN_01993 [Haematococcus lacustris]|uniref:Uncharacterized protein n=1 Tax=Haematococcus lacustris TaxID=44745 RepID=A0A699YCT7_HAELA|nr:hypothetical protein HaLaN_01993 [Haematococcus lacustris]